MRSSGKLTMDGGQWVRSVGAFLLYALVMIGFAVMTVPLPAQSGEDGGTSETVKVAYSPIVFQGGIVVPAAEAPEPGEPFRPVVAGVSSGVDFVEIEVALDEADPAPGQEVAGKLVDEGADAITDPAVIVATGLVVAVDQETKKARLRFALQPVTRERKFDAYLVVIRKGS